MACRLTLVAEEGGEVVGFAELEEDGHLDMLYVRKVAGGRGVGKRLCRAAERKALGLGLGRVFTEAGMTARPVFEGRGFRVLHRNDLVVRGVEMTNLSWRSR